MSKILLIKPRFLNFDFRAIAHPMGLMYIGAALKKAGHEPMIHDCAFDYTDFQRLRRTIKEWKPDFIGISIIVTELKQTKNIMGVIRETLPHVPVTFGGPWPSANPEDALKIFGADFVVIGEGELVFPELIDAINNVRSTESIPGTASIVDGRIKINPGQQLTEDELNTLPFPAWDLLDHDNFSKKQSGAGVGCRPYMTIVTSRGCPFQCIYCHQTLGKSFRKRSAESVLAEVEVLRFKYGFKELEIVDDCFNFDRERMHGILNGIRDKIGDVKLHFHNGLRADILEAEDLSLLRQAGTVSAMFAIETSSPRLQKMIRKNLNIDKAAMAINTATKEGIFSTGYLMMGFPTETYKEASGTAEFAARSTLHRALFYNPTPFAGTVLADMAISALINRNNINPHEVNYFNKINISAMSNMDLHRVFQHAYMRFYLNPKRILRIAMHHPNFFSLPRYALIACSLTLSRRHSAA